MTWEWFQANWESIYNIYGVGILGAVAFVWIFRKYRKLQERYKDQVDRLYRDAYDIALKVLEEKMKLEVTERVHARDKWERAVEAHIAELKRERG